MAFLDLTWKPRALLSRIYSKANHPSEIHKRPGRKQARMYQNIANFLHQTRSS